MVKTASRTFVGLNQKQRKFSKQINVKITSNWCRDKEDFETPDVRLGDSSPSWSWSGDGCSRSVPTLAQATNVTTFYCFFADIQIRTTKYFASNPWLRILSFIISESSLLHERETPTFFSSVDTYLLCILSLCVHYLLCL